MVHSCCDNVVVVVVVAMREQNDCVIIVYMCLSFAFMCQSSPLVSIAAWTAFTCIHVPVCCVRWKLDSDIIRFNVEDHGREFIICITFIKTVKYLELIYIFINEVNYT